MIGIVKFTASVAVLLLAGLATLLVFEVIPPEVFSQGVKKTLLTLVIAGLTAGALAFIVRLGK